VRKTLDTTPPGNGTQRLIDPRIHDLRGSRQTHLTQLDGNLVGLLLSRLDIFLCVDGLQLRLATNLGFFVTFGEPRLVLIPGAWSQ